MRHVHKGTYRIKIALGSGGFGKVYLAEHVKTYTDVAIKFEEDPDGVPRLLHERAIYDKLNGAAGFPTPICFGSENSQAYLVMELLGKSLRALFRESHKQFSMKTVLMLIDQMICRVEFLHRQGIVHRDLKPSNFVMGIGPHLNQLHLIDFGLSEPYACEAERESPPRFAGTPCYASLRAQKGYPCFPRDDMESLGYIFVYLATGWLPWRMETISSDRKGVFEAVMAIKESTPIPDLCRGLPDEFSQYLTVVMNMAPEEIPDYAGFRKMFRDRFLANGDVYDSRYDWSSLIHSHMSFNFPTKRRPPTPPPPKPKPSQFPNRRTPSSNQERIKVDRNFVVKYPRSAARKSAPGGSDS
jgi:serine/threonine protein kinase